MATRTDCRLATPASIVSYPLLLPALLGNLLKNLAELDLPEYESYEALRHQLYTAITAGSEYFGFA